VGSNSGAQTDFNLKDGHFMQRTVVQISRIDMSDDARCLCLFLYHSGLLAGQGVQGEPWVGFRKRPSQALNNTLKGYPKGTLEDGKASRLKKRVSPYPC